MKSPESQNMTVFGNKVFANRLVETKSHWSRWAPIQYDLHPYNKGTFGHRHTHRMKVEVQGAVRATSKLAAGEGCRPCRHLDLRLLPADLLPKALPPPTACGTLSLRSWETNSHSLCPHPGLCPPAPCFSWCCGCGCHPCAAWLLQAAARPCPWTGGWRVWDGRCELTAAGRLCCGRSWDVSSSSVCNCGPASNWCVPRSPPSLEHTLSCS